MKDLFTDGHVDHAIFQPAALGEFYRSGSGQTEEAWALTRDHPDKLTYNHNFDPRNGEAGLDQLRADAERFGLKGVKLYTAEWHGDSRGYKLTDPWAYKYLEVCRELGIRNIHVHKGPTIRPLDRDAFDVADVDHVATDFSSDYALWTPKWLVEQFVDFQIPADVAALADAGLTAYHAVAKASRRLHPGDRAVLIGAGGLGHIGIQVLAALSPAEIVVVDRNPDAVKLALEIGADHGIVADGSQAEQVLELTGGHGAEQVVDFVGEGGSTAEGLRMTRRAGDYHVVGYGENIDVPTIDLISTEVNIIGNLVGSYNDLVALMALAVRKKVVLHTAKYPMDRFQDALDDLSAGRVRGRAILVP